MTAVLDRASRPAPVIEAQPAGLLARADQYFSDRAVSAACVAGLDERESAWQVAGRITEAEARPWPRKAYVYAALILRFDERRREVPLLANQGELMSSTELVADHLEAIDRRRDGAIEGRRRR